MKTPIKQFIECSWMQEENKWYRRKLYYKFFVSQRKRMSMGKRPVTWREIMPDSIGLYVPFAFRVCWHAYNFDLGCGEAFIPAGRKKGDHWLSISIMLLSFRVRWCLYRPKEA